MDGQLRPDLHQPNELWTIEALVEEMNRLKNIWSDMYNRRDVAGTTFGTTNARQTNEQPLRIKQRPPTPPFRQGGYPPPPYYSNDYNHFGYGFLNQPFTSNTAPGYNSCPWPGFSGSQGPCQRSTSPGRQRSTR